MLLASVGLYCQCDRMPTTSPAVTAVVVTLLFSPPAASSEAPSLERRYLSTRDDYVGRFEKNASPGDDRHALEELEQLLRAIVGPVKVAGLAGPGAINLETLLPDAGFGQIDGLKFRWGQDWLFVTTRGLLDDYLARDKKLPKDLVALAETDEFYRRVLDWDVAVTRFGELPTTPPTSMTVAKASLALSAQDIGPWPPSTILVFAARGDRIFVVMSSLKDRPEQVPACEARWNEGEAKYRQALRAWRSARPSDRSAHADPGRYEEEGFEAYRRCFARALPGHPSFAVLTRRAQDIINRLQEQ